MQIYEAAINVPGGVTEYTKAPNFAINDLQNL